MNSLLLAFALLQDVRITLQGQPILDGNVVIFAGKQVPLPATEGVVRFWIAPDGAFIDTPDDPWGTVQDETRVSDGAPLIYCGYAIAMPVRTPTTWWQMTWVWVQRAVTISVH